MSSTALNRTGVSVLQNKSGSSVAQGDTVIINTAAASSFTTTTTSGFVNGLIGVVLEPNGIANDDYGLVAFGTWIPKINLNTAATVGQFIKHHSVAKQGTPHSSPMVAGDFAIALEASATPKALLFGSINQGSGGGSLTNSNIAPTTSNINASVNTRHFADVSGMTADRNFVLPAGAIGDEIELNITVGDTEFEFIVIGDTGITINGGSSATEWSRLFITGESVRLIADSTTSWRVVHDGRKPCIGLLHLSAADTTNTAGAPTTPTWDTKTVDRGEIGDTTNFQFNIRRAGYYRISGSYLPNSAISDQNYMYVAVKQNGTIVLDTILYASGNNVFSAPLSPKDVLCAVGDALLYQYQTQQADKGILNDTRSFFQVEEVF